MRRQPSEPPDELKVKLPKRKIGKYKSVDYPFKVIPERF